MAHLTAADVATIDRAHELNGAANNVLLRGVLTSVLEGLQVAEIELTAANIIAMNATPVELVAGDSVMRVKVAYRVHSTGL